MTSTVRFILRRLVKGIGFLPAVIALIIGLLAILQLLLGSVLKPDWEWVQHILITDTETVQPVLSVVIGAIFTFTIFSYTMVMNVLSQSISNFSPRLVPLLLAERHHQVILGISSGTIVYSLILFISISASTGNKPPPFGAFGSLVLAVICLGLFVYFVHRISRSIHINHMLFYSYRNTLENMNFFIARESFLCEVEEIPAPENNVTLKAVVGGYLSDIDYDTLSTLAKETDGTIWLMHRAGQFVYSGEAFLKASGNFNKWQLRRLKSAVRVSQEEPLDIFQYGFKHLTEVAVKACSPGINDPATAVTAINYLTDLFLYHAAFKFYNCYDKKGKVYFSSFTFQELIQGCYAEMYTYMNHDPLMVDTLKMSLEKIESHCKVCDAPEDYMGAVMAQLAFIEANPISIKSPDQAWKVR